MDSPIFGSQKSSQYSKCQKYPEYSTTQSQINPPEWYVTSKNSINSSTYQISHDLKLAYTLLIVQKNMKFFSSKINRCLNTKKNEAFLQIFAHSTKQSRSIQKEAKQLYKSSLETLNNPEMKPLAIVCTSKVNQKLQNVCRIVNCLKLKKTAKAWSYLYIMKQKHHLPAVLNEYSSCVESDLGICSKIEAKKNLNSKKHAKQMKQNSILNQTNSELQIDNEKLMVEIMNEEKLLDKFTEQMKALLAPHESKLLSDSDRETLLSDNGISHSSLQNHVKVRKNQPNKKR